MSQFLSKEQIEDLIEICGSSPTFWRQNDMLICCPVHGESNPSMGISADKQVCHCFSCGFKGDLSWLLFKSRQDEFKNYRQAVEYFEERYELERKNLNGKVFDVSRYEDTMKPLEVKRKTLPMYELAPFKSGKETYKYFFDRSGDFTKKEMQEYMIGRDLDSKTVTIPIFYEDGALAGIIGRFISKKRKHNERYKIYSFERGKITYPLDKYDGSDTMIIVEGCFDAIRIRRLGYKNTQALMSNNMTREQANLIADLCSSVIYVGDNDSIGIEAKEENIKLLEERGLNVLRVTYPNYGKDPCDWTNSDIRKMIGNAGKKSVKIKRME